MTRVFRGLCLAIAAAAAGCGSAAPPSTTTPPPPNDPGLTITGNEHLGWTQTGDDADRYVYVLYVDEARYELSRTSCAPSAPQVFDCQSPLPPLTDGTHTLHLTAAIRDGDALLEGSRSVPLVVTVTGSAGAQSITIAPGPPPTATRAATDDAASAGPSCGLAEWDATHVLAWTSRGELAVASRDRRALQTLAWTNEAGGDWRLSAVVLHIEGSRRLVFVTLTSIGAEPRLRVLRYRELSGVLGERATIVDIPLAGPAATVNTSFAPDGRLSIAVMRQALPAAPEPFVVTAALDGAAPIDMDPLVSRAPVAGTWDGNGHFWIVERSGSGISARVGDAVIARLSLGERDSVIGVQALDGAGTSGIAIFTSRGKGWLLSPDAAVPQQPAAISFFRGNDGSYQSMLTLDDIVFGCAALPRLSLDYAKWVHSPAMPSRPR